MLFVWERFVSRLQCPQGEGSHGDGAGPRERSALCPGPEGRAGAVGLSLPSARPRIWLGPHHGPVPSLPLPCSPFPAEPALTCIHPGEGRQDEASAGWMAPISLQHRHRLPSPMQDPALTGKPRPCSPCVAPAPAALWQRDRSLQRCLRCVLEAAVSPPRCPSATDAASHGHADAHAAPNHPHAALWLLKHKSLIIVNN